MTLSSARANRSMAPSHATFVSDEVRRTTRSTSDYEARKLAQQCTYPGCKRKPADGHSQCTPHRDDARERKNRSQNRIRQERRAAGECRDCGLPCDGHQCAACAIRQGRVPAEHNAEDKSQRIAARMIPWENSPQNEGRLRMRGGDKGRRSIHEENRADFDLLEKEIVHARKAEAYLHTPAVAESPRIQREAAWLEAKDKLALAVRYAVEIIKRGPGKHPLLKQIAVSDDDEET